LLLLCAARRAPECRKSKRQRERGRKRSKHQNGETDEGGERKKERKKKRDPPASDIHSAFASVISVDSASVWFDLNDVLLRGAGSGGHAVLDFSCHGDERLFDVCAAFCRSLKEGNAERVCKVLCRFLVHLALVLQVALVADKQLVHVLTRIALDFTQPLLHVREGRGIRDVVHNNDAVRSTIIGRGDCTETLLASSVPDLELDRLAVELDSADLKVHTNSADVALCVRVVRKTQKKAALADTAVSNKEKD